MGAEALEEAKREFETDEPSNVQIEAQLDRRIIDHIKRQAPEYEVWEVHYKSDVPGLAHKLNTSQFPEVTGSNALEDFYWRLIAAEILKLLGRSQQ